MNRRESLKAIGLTTLSTGVLLQACKPGADKTAENTSANTSAEAGRQSFEIERDKRLNSEVFFNKHEMETITILADIIIPKDDVSGSASDAKVADFIEFIVKDMPEHKTPMRGGLRWIDMYCLNHYNNPFKSCSSQQQIELVDQIAYPSLAKPEMQPGVTFFNRMRGLTLSGFYTSKIGIKDVGYMGNTPGEWNGVPEDILKQYGMENV
jgi:hypothetical protein